MKPVAMWADFGQTHVMTMGLVKHAKTTTKHGDVEKNALVECGDYMSLGEIC